MKSLLMQNIIVAAKAFNPSIFSQLWLMQQGFINEQDKIEHQILQPMIAQLFTHTLELTVIPDRMQIVFINELRENPDTLVEKTKGIIKALQHTPYVAIGANFDWKITSRKLMDIIERLFKESSEPFLSNFANPGTKFGFFISLEPEELKPNITVNLDIRPLKGQDDDMRCAFNCNMDLTGDNKIDDMSGFLDKYNLMKKYSDNILSTIIDNK